MKKLASKLNNFKLTSIVVAVIQVIGILAAAGAIVCYTFAGGVKDGLTVPALNYIKGQPMRQVYGMIFFLACITAIVVSCLVIYNLFPNILNKEKVNTKKGWVITGTANAIIHLIIIGFSLIIVFDVNTPLTLVYFYVTMGVSGLFVILNALMIYPLKRCEFYQPEIIKK